MERFPVLRRGARSCGIQPWPPRHPWRTFAAWLRLLFRHHWVVYASDHLAARNMRCAISVPISIVSPSPTIGWLLSPTVTSHSSGEIPLTAPRTLSARYAVHLPAHASSRNSQFTPWPTFPTTTRVVEFWRYRGSNTGDVPGPKLKRRSDAAIHKSMLLLQRCSESEETSICRHLD
jgi:hypothetical protein